MARFLKTRGCIQMQIALPKRKIETLVGFDRKVIRFLYERQPKNDEHIEGGVRRVA
jgi:hypothetical protein